ncbi:MULTISPECIES: sigma factor-like helix-turn-helix DNA-binding protein [unclassified Streptosporangium]|uniref:sigma factor-like helix-turn-helix DNA-binding protein n=1 Tax=unclassified Streptosporangium TaxID=2632669 RepID=UPI002E2ACE71|nr:MULTISPECIES: sigma factor-like helix-turn-helix DNA-binding protein [unclassified Streptosporangium]
MFLAVRALPRRQREAVVPRYYLDLSEGDIAEVMRVSRGTVKSTTSRALKTLAAKLEESRDFADRRPAPRRLYRWRGTGGRRDPAPRRPGCAAEGPSSPSRISSHGSAAGCSGRRGDECCRRGRVAWFGSGTAHDGRSARSSLPAGRRPGCLLGCRLRVRSLLVFNPAKCR